MILQGIIATAILPSYRGTLASLLLTTAAYLFLVGVVIV